MPVNRPQNVRPPADTADQRVYLRDQDLDQGAALIRIAARALFSTIQTKTNGLSLSDPQLEILQELHDTGSMDVSELRKVLNAPKQSLARHLNDLEKSGFINRVQDTEDRRRRLVGLTEQGKTLTDAMTKQRRDLMRKIYLDAGPEVVTGARRLLQEIASLKDQS